MASSSRFTAAWAIFYVFKRLQKLFLLKQRRGRTDPRKSGSVRLCPRIFTAKENQKNLGTTAIGTTVRSGASTQVLTLILLKKRWVSQASVSRHLGHHRCI
ncbi:hypothetical protein BSK56_32035 [Paenibacillus borealis]|uniref:Secreted protein n=1 Tax=Paenibacillus borealis TaxID=160799 RepID=A0ABX3GU18_PAEBO|nr:hypothetical protein BSK56_32035 [Paenibacillus borealis]